MVGQHQLRLGTSGLTQEVFHLIDLYPRQDTGSEVGVIMEKQGRAIRGLTHLVFHLIEKKYIY